MLESLVHQLAQVGLQLSCAASSGDDGVAQQREAGLGPAGSASANTWSKAGSHPAAPLETSNGVPSAVPPTACCTAVEVLPSLRADRAARSPWGLGCSGIASTAGMTLPDASGTVSGGPAAAGPRRRLKGLAERLSASRLGRDRRGPQPQRRASRLRKAGGKPTVWPRLNNRPRPRRRGPPDGVSNAQSAERQHRCTRGCNPPWSLPDRHPPQPRSK